MNPGPLEEQPVIFTAEQSPATAPLLRNEDVSSRVAVLLSSLGKNSHGVTPVFRTLHLSPKGLWRIPFKSHIVVGSVSSFLELQYPHPFVLCYCDTDCEPSHSFLISDPNMQVFFFDSSIKDFSNTVYIKSPPLEFYRWVAHHQKCRHCVHLATLQVHAAGRVHVQVLLIGGSVWEVGARAGFRSESHHLFTQSPLLVPVPPNLCFRTKGRPFNSHPAFLSHL